MQCGVCGGSDFISNKVLWPELVAEWQLAPDEEDYVNRQQGTCCKRCGANLRSIALANAICAFLGVHSTLQGTSASDAAQALDILEVNEAGTLTPTLSRMGRYTYAAFPEVDMLAMPYGEGAFDLIVHSDTLEHVEHPVRALSECMRILKPRGAVCFTVPVIVGRLSRSRAGLRPSYHGSSGALRNDYVVQTEFGADAWTYAMEAGFSEIAIHAVDYPAATAFLARK
jgi:SAM-dependent methyltransferase